MTGPGSSRSFRALCGALVLAASPALADDAGEDGHEALDPVLLDAIELCPDFIAGGDEVIEALREQGWEIFQPPGDDPYFYEFSAARAYPGVGQATMFTGVEVYPGTTLAYCVFSIAEPGRPVLLEGLEEVAVDLETHSGSDGDYASWRSPDADLYGRAAVSPGEFLIQVTRIEQRAESYSGQARFGAGAELNGP